MKHAPFAAALFMLFCVTGSAAAQSDPGRDAFLQWAKGAGHPLSSLEPTRANADLASLARMIGRASIVAVTEGVHDGAEPLAFRNLVFQYLVEHQGFTAIAIESGITEGRVVHDYVRGGTGDLATVLAQGISWTFDKLPQNAALIRWIREYNADPRHLRKVNFYGFDVPGSPGNPDAHRGMRTALDEVLGYLDRVDTATAMAFHSRLDPYLPDIQLDPRARGAARYLRLSQAERDAVTAAIADLVATFEAREAAYQAASSPTDYQWAYRSALGARSVDTWLRQIPIGWLPSSGWTFLSKAINIRDRTQADNLGWIVDQEGPDGKVVVFAARVHLSTAPVKTSQSAPGVGDAVAGTYLRRRFGSRLVTIGNLIGKGTSGCGGYTDPVGVGGVATPESIDGVVGMLGQPMLLLDLRGAPTMVRSWLDREHDLEGGPYGLKVEVGKAFDILFYLDTVTPACPK
jgi:erythromycin esterase